MSEPRPRTESELLEQLRSIDVRAPQELHGRIEAMVAERSAGRGRTGAFGGRTGAFGWQLAGGLAVAVVVAVLVVVLAGGGSGGSRLTMHDALALTLSPATAPAPAKSASNGTQLAVSVGNVAFPYWGDLGWRSSGMRSDHVGGRTITTVFYVNRHGQRLGYAIVAGTPAPATAGGVVSWKDGTPYRLSVQDGSNVVSWRRDGQLCVVSGRGVAGATLLTLAGREGRDSTAS